MLKNNIDNSSVAIEEEEELYEVIKEKKRKETEYQHQCHQMNVLISENSKLKDQVNIERGKRAIYFNIYKNLEH